MCVRLHIVYVHMDVSDETICTPERPSCWTVERKDDFPSITVNISSSGGPAVARGGYWTCVYWLRFQ